MKSFTYLFLVLIVLSCSTKQTRKLDPITAYYKGLNASNFKDINTHIADRITIIEGDYIMPFNKNTFYQHFKWDSVFNTKYNLKNIDSITPSISIATVESRSLKFKFLKNNPLTCKFKFYLKSGNIYKIETLDCLNADWDTWQKEKDLLVKWIAINHPKLDGFIYDLSMKGAQNYLKAIALYQTKPSN